MDISCSRFNYRLVEDIIAITEAADKRKWDNVRHELDRTQNSVQQAMDELQDQKLSQLVSLGGWLRGTQILTAVVDRHFSPEGAELLHQPDLLRYFGDRLTGMPEYNVPVVQSIKQALVQDADRLRISEAELRIVTRRRPTTAGGALAATVTSPQGPLGQES